MQTELRRRGEGGGYSLLIRIQVHSVSDSFQIQPKKIEVLITFFFKLHNFSYFSQLSMQRFAYAYIEQKTVSCMDIVSCTKGKPSRTWLAKN